MAEQAIKQIQIGENKHDIDATYWGGKTIGEKQDTLVSGSNIKTIGGEDILGDGNIKLKVFVGTQAEYDEEIAKDNIAIGALVVILDDNESPGGGGSGGNEGELPETSEITAKLGKAILGKMKLGQE